MYVSSVSQTCIYIYKYAHVCMCVCMNFIECKQITFISYIDYKIGCNFVINFKKVFFFST